MLWGSIRVFNSLNTRMLFVDQHSSMLVQVKKLIPRKSSSIGSPRWVIIHPRSSQFMRLTNSLRIAASALNPQPTIDFILIFPHKKKSRTPVGTAQSKSRIPGWRSLPLYCLSPSGQAGVRLIVGRVTSRHMSSHLLIFQISVGRLLPPHSAGRRLGRHAPG